MLPPVDCGGLTFDVVESVGAAASVVSDVRVVGCTISLGTGPVDPVGATSDTTLLTSEVTSDTILLRSEVIGSPVGSNPVPVADPVPDPVTVVAASVVSVSRLVGWMGSLGTGPVEAEPVAEPVAVTSETTLLRSEVTWDMILPRSEVSGSPVEDCWVALVTVVSVALGVSSDEMPVVVSACDDADGVSTVVSETVVLSAVVAVGASSAVVVVVGTSSAVVVVVGTSSSVVLVLEAGDSTVLVVTVVALLVSESASDAVGIKTGPDGPRLVRMSDNERL